MNEAKKLGYEVGKTYTNLNGTFFVLDEENHSLYGASVKVFFLHNIRPHWHSTQADRYTVEVEPQNAHTVLEQLDRLTPLNIKEAVAISRWRNALVQKERSR